MMGKFGRREGNGDKVKAKLRRGLSVVVFDQQEVYRNVKPFISALNNASFSMANWSVMEENLAIQVACTKMFEVSQLATTVIEEFSKEYLTLGNSLKNLLCREMDLANLRKNVYQAEEKAAKLKKQNTEKEAKEKSKDGAVSSRLLEDLGNAELAYEEQKASFDVQATKHEILKAKCIQEALTQLAANTSLLAKQLSVISHALNELANTIPVVPTHVRQITGENKYEGAEHSDEIVQKAVDSLNITQPLTFKEFEDRRKQQRRQNKVHPRPLSCLSDPPSPSASSEWVVVEPLSRDSDPVVHQGILDQQMLASLKNRLGVEGIQGRSYISNRRIEDRLAAKHRALGMNIKSRPPAPPPRPLPSPCNSPPHNSPPPRPHKDFPRVEPYAVSCGQPNEEGLYARTNLFETKRLWRSWSGEKERWTGEQPEECEQQEQPLRDDNNPEVVYAVLERDNNEELPGDTSHYLDVLH